MRDMKLCVDAAAYLTLGAVSTSGFLPPSPHVKGSLTLVTSAVSNEPDGVQTTEALPDESAAQLGARGSLDMG
jgi:hypothetical protein